MSTKEWREVSYGRARVIDIDSHRNGVSGAPFVVALIEFQGDNDADTQKFHVQSMRGPSSMVPTKEQELLFAEQTTAIDINNLLDIPLAENAWRGADMFGRLMVDAYREYCLAEDHTFDPFIDNRTIGVA